MTPTKKVIGLRMEEKLPTLDFREVVYFYIPWTTVKASTDFMLFSPKVVCFL